MRTRKEIIQILHANQYKKREAFKEANHIEFVKHAFLEKMLLWILDDEVPNGKKAPKRGRPKRK